MSNKKANITLAVLSVLLIATWIWFFVSRKEAPVLETGTPTQSSSIAK